MTNPNTAPNKHFDHNKSLNQKASEYDFEPLQQVMNTWVRPVEQNDA
jgi:hypothetical protein